MYIYLFFSVNAVCHSFKQDRLDNIEVNRRRALVSGSILSAPPRACLKATLGTDKLHLADTDFGFIRINGNMDQKVSAKLDDEILVVTPYEIRMKDN